MLKITIKGYWCELSRPVPDEIDMMIDDLCKYQPDGIEFAESVREGDWDGYRHLYQWRKFPIGMLTRVKMALEMKDIDHQIYDRRTVGTKEIIEPLRKLWPYQLPIVLDAIMQKSGLIQAPTGSGKTVMMIRIMAALGLRTLVIVPVTDLIDQVLSEMDVGAGIVGTRITTDALRQPEFLQEFCNPRGANWYSKTVANSPLKTTIPGWFVSTWQGLYANIRKPKTFRDDDHKALWKETRKRLLKLLRTIDVVCFDEVHTVAADCVYKVAKCVDATHRYGFSATMFRPDNREMQFHAAVGDINVGITASELIRVGEESGWTMGLVRPEIIFKSPPRPIYPLRGPWQDVYREHIVDNEDRNEWIANQALDLTDEGRTVLVMCQQIRQGETLSQLLGGAPFVHGSVGKKKRKEITDGFRAGEIPLVISSSVWNVGVDFPIVTGGVMAGPYKSPIQNVQRVGRFLRVDPLNDKTDCKIIETWDPHPFLRDWSQARFDIYTEEEEFDVR